MLLKKLNWIFVISVLALTFQSCSEDNDAFNELEATIDERGGNNNGGGGGNNNGNNNENNPLEKDVKDINSELALDWMDLYLELERYAAGMRPNASARSLAYINLAAYETAQPGMRDFISNSNLIPGLNIDDDLGNDEIDWEIALNACYADVLNHFLLNVPSDLVGKIKDLERRNENRLSDRRPRDVVRDSKDWGESIAKQIILFSQTDAAAESQILSPQPISYEPPTGDGYWTYSAEPERALFPYWGSVRTFVISSDETSTVPPMDYSEQPNSPYFQEMQEVYEANNSAKANQGEQLWIAEFWSDDVENLTFSPPARQLAIARQLIDRYNMNLEEALHLNLKLGFSLNDAAVSTWADKYEYMVMRPSVFIHEFIDPSYQTNLFRLIPWPNPSFPGYPSGHSCFASAAAGVFINFFGNNTNFTDRSHQGRTEFESQPRTFSTFSNMAEENAFSRIPLGVHIRMDCAEGLRLGYEISAAVNDYNVEQGSN